MVNIFLGITIMLGVVALIYVIYHNILADTKNKKVKEWLIYACLKAESKFGRETGKIKLRFVYDLFISKFTIVSKIITFDDFETLVGVALDEAKKILGTNPAVAELVEKGEF